ncbi:MAG: hypothetical protein K0U40_05595 [Betaproteobacteria bacterium]|nr:hypothetical protein [Betaproteobacteria bacterium]
MKNVVTNAQADPMTINPGGNNIIQTTLQHHEIVYAHYWNPNFLPGRSILSCLKSFVLVKRRF